MRKLKRGSYFLPRVGIEKMERTLARLQDNPDLFLDDDIRDLITKLSEKVRIKAGTKEVED